MSSLRLLAGGLVLAVVASACVNQGFDAEPTAAEGDLQSESAAESPGDGTSEAESAAGQDQTEAGDDDGLAADLPVGAVADPSARASIEEVECPFGEPVPLPRRPVCYSVTVPEDWSDPASTNEVALPVAVFEAAEGRDDMHAWALDTRGALLRRIGDPIAAIADHREALTRVAATAADPQSPRLVEGLLLLAEAQLDAGRSQSALQSLLRVRSILDEVGEDAPPDSAERTRDLMAQVTRDTERRVRP